MWLLKGWNFLFFPSLSISIDCTYFLFFLQVLNGLGLEILLEKSDKNNFILLYKKKKKN